MEHRSIQLPSDAAPEASRVEADTAATAHTHPAGAPAGPESAGNPRHSQSGSCGRAGRLGVGLGLLVALLAFLLASFPARNSDLWEHLAAGKRLAHRESSFHPRTGVGDGVPVGRTWLYDLLSYWGYSAAGGAGLVAIKALLVAGLALVLLRLSWTGQGPWVPAACTLLALLAMSTRLLLQPATVSYLLLGLALWCLRDDKGGNRAGAASLLPPWPLLVLFLAWVNLDGWFVLGLAVVALVWFGQDLDQPLAPAGRLAALARHACSLLLLGGVCLLNPHHVRAFALPPELGWLGSGSHAAPGVAAPITSPFREAYLENLGLTPATLAYYPLLGLGALSFLVNLPRWRWQTFLPWLGLAVLSALQARAIPFFAVVGGPVLAWNWQDSLAPRSAPTPAHALAWEQALTVGRMLTLAAALALPVCAWPGWLQGPPYEPRRREAEPAPSQLRAAVAVCRWQHEGMLARDSHGLHWSRETARTFAWFCPDEKGVLDGELTSAILAEPAGAVEWGPRMRAAGIDHLILYDPDRARLLAGLARLLAQPDQWPLLHLEGDLAIFGWRDPAAPAAKDPLRGRELDLNRLAFHPTNDKRAPARSADQSPDPRRWWEAFWKPAPPRPIDRDEAGLHLLHAQALQPAAAHRHLARWQQSQSAALVAAAGGWAGPGGAADAYLRLVLLRPRAPERRSDPGALAGMDRVALRFRQAYMLEQDDSPPALLYLAIRAARRALAVNPGDAQAELILGESYLQLLRGTRERAWAERLPQLAELRRAQASAALNRAVSLNPDLARAHLSLSALYRATGCLDLAVDHLRAYARLARQAERPPDVEADRFREQQAAVQEELNRLAREVDERTKAYAAESAGLRVLDRVSLALRKGLAGIARDTLLGSDVSAFGPRGMELELGLLLATGRPKQVCDWTQPEQQVALGAASYHWLRAQAFAASGDYARAEAECEEMGPFASEEPAEGPSRLQRMAAALIGQAVLDEQPGAGSAPALAWGARRRAEFGNRLAGLTAALREEANAAVFRGLLALEEGRVDEAEVAFRLALAVSRNEPAAAEPDGVEFNGRVVAQICLEWLK
jgi:hypothetical protein